MNNPLLQVTLGYIRRHLLQNILLIIGIAFGVALVVSVDIANQSASRSFVLSTEVLSTKSTHYIVGTFSDFNESIYKDLKVELGVTNMAPIVEDYVNIPGLDGRAVKLLGTDFFADLIFYDNQNNPLPQLSEDNFRDLITRPGTALISQDLVQGLGVERGDLIKVEHGSNTFDIEIIGMLESKNDQAKSIGGLILTDISSAQELLGKVGRLSKINLATDSDSQDSLDVIGEIKEYLPSEVEIKEKDVILSSVKKLTRSFELNLTALSLFALYVGIFLIYNIVSFSVIQRRKIIGTLRSIGATRGQIFRMIISEALFIGIIGSIIGVIGGVFLGRFLVSLVSQSINDLYFTIAVTDFSISHEIIIKGLLAGMLAVLISAIVPAYEASRFSPVNIMRRSTLEGFFTKSINLFAIFGLISIALAYLLILLPTKSLVVSLVSVFLFLFGVSLLIPFCTRLLMRLLAFVLSPLGLIGQMAPRNINRNTSRTAVSIASLTVAISVIISVSIMIGSFRSTVVIWLDTALTADIFITMESSNISSQAGLDPEIIDVVSKSPGVDRVASVRRVLYDSPDYGLFNLIAVTEDLAVQNRDFKWSEYDSNILWDNIQSNSVLISESFAYKNNIHPGEELVITLPTDAGNRDFKVSGIYYDYGAQGGVVLISDELYRKLWNDEKVNSLGVYVSNTQDVDITTDQLRSNLSDYSNLSITSNDTLKKSAIKTFDRTFTVTSALRLLIALVAFISVLSSLMALQLEREREFGILRAVGMTTGQLRKMLFLENGLIGLTSGLFSIPVGITLSLILIYVINLRSFGWTLNFSIEPRYFIEALAIALVASILAGVYPAYLICREHVGKLIREE